MTYHDTPEGFSHRVELVEKSWDITFGESTTVFFAVVCQVCGALVDEAATDKHHHGEVPWRS